VEQIVKWSEISEREKVRLILEHVLGWTLFADFDAYHAALWKTGEYVSVSYPVAFWVEERECWSVRHQDHEDGEVFDPLYSMDDAWAVLLQIATLYSEQDEYVNETFARFVDDLLPNSGGEIWTAWKCMANEVAKWTPERICFAALSAIGVEIEA
jgi:hypothetical protein